MTDTFEFTLDNPLTEEQWDMIEDVDFDRTDHITFHTKHGKKVEFTKVIRCKDCEHYSAFHMDCYRIGNAHPRKDDYCSWAKRREK